ncbi:MAG: hypothetical protein HPY44_17285 [Armatimonadetes bacterium]|nr:hypothetical protein [Armatimonadota bacterium]
MTGRPAPWTNRLSVAAHGMAALLAVVIPLAADPLLPVVTLPLMETPPTIDGRIDEAEWSGAARNVGLCSQYDLMLGARDAIFWVGAGADTLYIAQKTELPPGGEILNRAVADGDRDIVAALHDDSVELVIHPHLGATTGDQRYFHIIANPRGTIFDRSFDPSNPQNSINTAWRIKGWKYQSQLLDGYWHVEIAIPFASIGATAGDLAHPWGIRICRNWQRGWDQSRWESVSAPYEDIPTMPRVSFSPTAPIVQVLGLRSEGKPRIELGVALPASATGVLPVRVAISDTWSRNPPTEVTRDIILAPAAREIVTFEPPDGGPEGAHRTIIRVTSPDGERTFYQREFTWKLEVPAERWEVGKEDRQAIEFQYKVYPYYGKLKVRVGVKSLASRDQVRRARLQVRQQPDGPDVLVTDLQFTDYEHESIHDIGNLAEGAYEISVTLMGGEGVPAEPVSQVYERKVFAWEHNQMGLSQRVIPPFTAIDLNGNTLSTVLREHSLNGAGIWDQVKSLGKPLLKGPMRWVVRTPDGEQQVSAGELAAAERRPDFVVTRGSFTAGPLAARIRSEWEQDGMAKVHLQLDRAQAARSDAAVERVSLEIPLDDSQMPYMHACGDGLRFNFAGRTPAGDGPVWNSNEANRTNIVGTFYPYIWLGGGERGLAWFADTDKGWSLDESTPTIELIRQDETLLLRVNFITRPTTLETPREIVFGLQATPAKPMPEEPVNWRRWICSSTNDIGVQPFTIVGATYYYGMLSYDLWPRGRDLSIYDAFSRARDTGEYDDAFVKQWVEGNKPYVDPESDMWKTYDIHVQSGMRSASGAVRSKGWLWTPYTNPRGMGFHEDEWPVFQDEWVNFPYQERSRSGSLAYEITPCESFRDAAMASYKEMMTCFDGIYWDNIFMAAHYDTVVGGAWVDEKGRIHPGMGLWAMRDLIKRTAFLFHEQGRPVFANVAHMTNTNIVPILSFANINLDWEWQYGKRDFQDRFAPDLTVAETIGRQCGNIPLILAGGFYDAKDPAYDWCMRTRLGVCLVHEIRVWDWQPGFHHEMFAKLFEFGYGTPHCRVYNYWDDGFPLQTEGADVRGIVLVNGQKAIAIVTDYGEGGDCRLKLDLKAIGLPETVTATNFETGKAMDGARGEARFKMKKHDFRAVLFE